MHSTLELDQDLDNGSDMLLATHANTAKEASSSHQSHRCMGMGDTCCLKYTCLEQLLLHVVVCTAVHFVHNHKCTA
jgi:hypothetical protein